MTIPLRGWFSALVRRESLSPAWEYRVRGVIWRLLPTERGQFVGEERDIEGKAVSFFCVRQDTGALQWGNLRLREPWWIGIEAVHNDLVLLHQYAVPDFPDHKKIHALDLSTGRLLWSNEDFKYLFAYGDNIYCSGELPDGPLYVELDSMSGRQNRELDAQEVNALRRTIQYREPVDFPVPFLNSEGDHVDVGGTIEKLVAGERRIQFIEFLQRNEFLAVAYYAAIGNDSDKLPGEPLAEPLMNQHFIIAEGRTGRVLFKEVLNSRASAAVPDSFFSLGDMLYSIAGKNVLKAFNLASSGLPNSD